MFSKKNTILIAFFTCAALALVLWVSWSFDRYNVLDAEFRILLFLPLLIGAIIVLFLRTELLEFVKYKELLLAVLLFVIANQTITLIEGQLRTPLSLALAVFGEVDYQRGDFLIKNTRYSGFSFSAQLGSFLLQSVWAFLAVFLLRFRYNKLESVNKKETLGLGSTSLSSFIRTASGVALGWLLGLLLFVPSFLFLQGVKDFRDSDQPEVTSTTVFYTFILLMCALGFCLNLITAPLLFTVNDEQSSFVGAVRRAFALGFRRWKLWLVPTAILFLLSGYCIALPEGLPEDWATFATKAFRAEHYLKWIWIWANAGLNEPLAWFLNIASDYKEARVWLVSNLVTTVLHTLILMNVARKYYSLPGSNALHTTSAE